MTRKCPQTGIIFNPHRYNQIFSSRKAQIDFNNTKAREQRSLKAPVDKMLNSNRNILKNIIGDKSQITKSYDFLLGAGFVFKYFSQSYLLEGKPVQAIYEYLIYQNDNKTFTIKKITL
jgi:hypothetical protein